MAPEHDDYQRVAPGDPERCAGIGRSSGSECPFKRMPSTLYCKMHHGDAHAKRAKKEALSVYNLQKYKDRVERLGDSSKPVRLDEELGVLRMLLETMLNKYEEVELLTNSGTISHLVGQIQSCLQANVKLKSQLGNLMDRAAIDKLCDNLIQVVSQVVAPEHMDKVSSKFASAIAEAVASRSD